MGGAFCSCTDGVLAESTKGAEPNQSEECSELYSITDFLKQKPWLLNIWKQNLPKLEHLDRLSVLQFLKSPMDYTY